MLQELCNGDRLQFQLVRELLSLEKRHKSMLRRVGLFDAIERAFLRSFYTSEEDAVERARKRRDALTAAREQVFGQSDHENLSQPTPSDTRQHHSYQLWPLRWPAGDSPGATCAQQAGRPFRWLPMVVVRRPYSTHYSSSGSVLEPRRRAADGWDTPSISLGTSTTRPPTGAPPFSSNSVTPRTVPRNRYTLRRAWREDAGGKCREEFRVLKNDRLAPALAERLGWPMSTACCLTTLPTCFLFDGEPDRAVRLA